MKRGKWKYLLVLYFGFIVIFRKEYSFKYVSYIIWPNRGAQLEVLNLV